jgi:hypothetical protein
MSSRVTRRRVGVNKSPCPTGRPASDRLGALQGGYCAENEARHSRGGAGRGAARGGAGRGAARRARACHVTGPRARARAGRDDAARARPGTQHRERYRREGAPRLDVGRGSHRPSLPASEVGAGMERTEPRSRVSSGRVAQPGSGCWATCRRTRRCTRRRGCRLPTEPGRAPGSPGTGGARGRVPPNGISFGGRALAVAALTPHRSQSAPRRTTLATHAQGSP